MTPGDAVVEMEIGVPVDVDSDHAVTAVGAALEPAVTAWLAELTPGRSPAIAVAALPSADGRIHVTVAGRRCWYPEAEVARSVAEALAGSAVAASDAARWPAERLAAWVVEVVQVALRANIDLLPTAGDERLGGGGVDLRVERSYLDQLMGSPGVQAADAPGRPAMARLRAELADAVGFDVPLRLVPDGTLPPATMRVTAGSAWAPLRRLLPLDAFALNIEPGALPSGLQVLGEIAVPWARQPMTVATGSDPFSESSAIFSVNALGYIGALALFDGRLLAHTLVTTERVEELLDTTYATPRLRALVSERVDLGRLTLAMGQLVSERVSLAPLEPLFQAALDADGADLVDRMRSQVPFRIQRTVCGGGTLLLPLAVGPRLLELVEHQPDDEAIEGVHEAVTARAIETGLEQPCLLTMPGRRTLLRRMVERALPSCDVVAHGELPPEVSVMPVEVDLP